MNDHGNLVDSDPSKSINACYRLVESAYFKKHRSAFQFSSLEQLFQDCAGRELSDIHHVLFLNGIRYNLG